MSVSAACKRLLPRWPLALATLMAGTALAQSEGLTEISAQHVDLRNGGVKGKADWVRYKLVEVNGPTGGYVLAAGHGNPAGYLGEINEVIGPRLLGALLEGEGIRRCADIPTRGQLSRELKIDGEDERLTAWFGVGNRVIPAHFERAGSLYGKHVVVAEGEQRTFEIQLTCQPGETLVSGYIWQTAASAGERGKEVYFQQDPSRGLSHVDVYYTHPPTGEHVGFRFATDGGELVRIWAVRAMTSGGSASSGFALAYAPATGAAMTSFLFGQLPPTDGTRFTEGTLECINLRTNQADSGCQAAGLVIGDPLPSAVVGGQSHPFMISGMALMEVRQGVPALPVPAEAEPDAGSADAGASDAGGDDGAQDAAITSDTG